MLTRCVALVALLCILAATASVADPSSGPDRTTLIHQDWGTIYHLPFGLDTTIEEDMLGEYTIHHGRSITSVKQEGYNQGYLVFYPDKTSMSVRKGEDGEIIFDVRGKRSYYRPTNDGWIVKLPTDEIRLRHKKGMVSISGKLGTTTVEDGPNGFTVKSRAGETRYAREDFDQPYKLTGPPVQAHPYVVKGIWFEAQGIGAFFDFKLADYSRAFSMIGWFPMLQVGE